MSQTAYALNLYEKWNAALAMLRVVGATIPRSWQDTQHIDRKRLKKHMKQLLAHHGLPDILT
jgi:hypothetical protein